LKFVKVSLTAVVVSILIIGAMNSTTSIVSISESSVNYSGPNNTHQISSDSTLIWETIGNPDYLDPHIDYESFGNWISYNVYETLYTYPWDSAVTDPSVPLLAASAPVLSFDGLNYTITVREDITFHDGTPFNASCVKWNIERAMKIFYLDGPVWMLAECLKGGATLESIAYSYGPSSAEFQSGFDNWVQNSGAIIVLDNYVVRFVLEDPYPAFIPALTYHVGSMMSPSYVIAHASDEAWASWEDYGTDYGEYDNYMTEHTCGTGPYKLTNWVPNQYIRLALNQDYWRTSMSTGAGSLEEIYIRTNEDITSRRLNLISGASDGCYWPVSNALDLWDSDTATSLYEGVYVSTGGISYTMTLYGFNMAGINLGTELAPNFVASPFGWENFRKAASWAFDYDAFITAARNGFGIRAEGPIPIGMYGHNGDYFDYTFNMTAAVEEWNKAMMDPAFVNALNDIDNTITFYYNSGNIEREQFSLILADGLQLIWNDAQANLTGLDWDMTATTQALEWSNYLDYIRARKLPLYFIGWSPDYADPDNYLFPTVYTLGTYAQRIGYNNSDVNDWYLQQRVENNSPLRLELLDNIQAAVAEDCPYLWGYQATEFRPWRTWLHGDGLVYNPMHGIYFYNMFKTGSTEPLPSDSIAPQVSHPDDIEFVVGTTGVNITWTATDQHMDTFEISRDGVVIDSGDWDSVYIQTNLDGLAIGNYTYTLTVRDQSNNSATDSVIVLVLPQGFDFSDPATMVITIGAIGGIIVVIIVIIRFKR